MATHRVPKGTMPMTGVKPGASPSTPGGLRQPVRTTRTKRTPLWLKEHHAQGGMGYHPTWGQRAR